MSNKELQELDIVIQALEANLQVFKMIQKGLNDKQRNFIERILRRNKMIGKKQLLRAFPRLNNRIKEFKMFDRQKILKPATVNPAFLN